MVILKLIALALITLSFIVIVNDLRIRKKKAKMAVAPRRKRRAR